jgi:hypothetical protein
MGRWGEERSEGAGEVRRGIEGDMENRVRRNRVVSVGRGTGRQESWESGQRAAKGNRRKRKKKRVGKGKKGKG